MSQTVTYTCKSFALVTIGTTAASLRKTEATLTNTVPGTTSYLCNIHGETLIEILRIDAGWNKIPPEEWILLYHATSSKRPLASHPFESAPPYSKFYFSYPSSQFGVDPFNVRNWLDYKLREFNKQCIPYKISLAFLEQWMLYSMA